jgi:hypothetical protein
MTYLFYLNVLWLIFLVVMAKKPKIFTMNGKPSIIVMTVGAAIIAIPFTVINLFLFK